MRERPFNGEEGKAHLQLGGGSNWLRARPLLVPIRTALRGSGFLRRDVEEVEDLEGGFGLVVAPSDLWPDGPQAHQLQDAAQHRRGARGLAAQQSPERPDPLGDPLDWGAARGRAELWPRGRRVGRGSAATLSDLDLPTFRFHAPSGDRKGRYAITVHGNWRVTFEFENGTVKRVDFEDYHKGKHR